MNIIDAIKSGKPYRRKNSLETFTPGDEYDFAYSEVLADDWEIESEPVTITREQFDGAWESVTNYISKTQPFFRLDLAQSMLCEKLGL